VTVYVAGALEVTVSDGKARRFAPGDVVLAEDPAGKVHHSRVLGAADALLVVVLLPD
jgi:quercetin dioxygenase-like cupin family protein